jgi:hypothetical protein
LPEDAPDDFTMPPLPDVPGEPSGDCWLGSEPAAPGCIESLGRRFNALVTPPWLVPFGLVGSIYAWLVMYAGGFGVVEPGCAPLALVELGCCVVTESVNTPPLM